jgi:hypothetical protein
MISSSGATGSSPGRELLGWGGEVEVECPRGAGWLFAVGGGDAWGMLRDGIERDGRDGWNKR